MQYTELHLHDHFSNLDGASTPVEYMTRAKELGMTHLAQTNHGTLAGMRDFQIAAKDAGITPIIGVEAYISATDRFDKRAAGKRTDGTSIYNHIILLAQDAQGLETLMQLNEIAWGEGFYHKPRIDMDLLEEMNDNIIVLSGCLNGLLCKAIDAGDAVHARIMTQRLKSILGDRFYIEIQPHNPPAMNEALLQLADMHGVPAVITSDCHHARASDAALQEAMLILSTNPRFDKTTDFSRSQKMEMLERFNYLYPGRTMTFEQYGLHLHDAQEHIGAMHPLERTDYIENTMRVAESIGEYPFHQGLDLLPPPRERDPDDLLAEKAHEGLGKRGLRQPEYIERLNQELEIIRSKESFSIYFLIVEDMVRWAKKKGIMVGPGRGSAAGSLVCYALGITQADPIKSGLLFFRFIDPGRDDFPDIDVDFEDTRRGEVQEYLRKKYKHVAAIQTFAEFADKGVVRDAARVLMVPLKDVNLALKRVDTWEQFHESERTREFRQKYPEVTQLAEMLRGRYRSIGKHASGLVISKEPINKYAPIETSSVKGEDDRVATVAYDMETVADIGLIKLDVLGLRTLSVISDAIKNIRKRRGKLIVPEKIPLDDPAIYADLSRGHTQGVFQAEAQPYTSLLINMGVDNFDQLAASTALVRPGAMDTIGEEYIMRKRGARAVSYDHEIMERITEETYGLVVYQEQVMLAMTELAGMTMGDANKVRKIIGKKKDPVEFEAFKDKWLEGASKHIPKKRAERLWKEFEAHAGYSFNKSHAVVYGMLTYWTAWLKHYYPLEFMHAVLLHATRATGKDKKDKITDYLIETKRLGIDVLLPHVNSSESEWSIDRNALRFGLSSIKFISSKLAGRLIANRPYTSYADLVQKVTLKGSGLTTRVLSSMNAIGAAVFDDNLRTPGYRENLYEYLGVPAFEVKDLEPIVKAKVRTLDEYAEDSAFVVIGMIRKIVRGEGWARVDVVDETGNAGIFTDQNTPMEIGNMYAMLVSKNRIVRYVTTEELVNKVKGAFVEYLYSRPGELVPEGALKVIAFRTHVTKTSNKRMAYIVVLDDLDQLHQIMAFPGLYHRVLAVCSEGDLIDAEVNETDDGSLFLKGVTPWNSKNLQDSQADN